MLTTQPTSFFAAGMPLQNRGEGGVESIFVFEQGFEGAKATALRNALEKRAANQKAANRGGAVKIFDTSMATRRAPIVCKDIPDANI